MNHLIEVKLKQMIKYDQFFLQFYQTVIRRTSSSLVLIDIFLSLNSREIGID